MHFDLTSFCRESIANRKMGLVYGQLSELGSFDLITFIRCACLTYGRSFVIVCLVHIQTKK